MKFVLLFTLLTALLPSLSTAAVDGCFPPVLNLFADDYTICSSEIVYTSPSSPNGVKIQRNPNPAAAKVRYLTKNDPYIEFEFNNVVWTGVSSRVDPLKASFVSPDGGSLDCEWLSNGPVGNRTNSVLSSPVPSPSPSINALDLILERYVIAETEKKNAGEAEMEGAGGSAAIPPLASAPDDSTAPPSSSTDASGEAPGKEKGISLDDAAGSAVIPPLTSTPDDSAASPFMSSTDESQPLEKGKGKGNGVGQLNPLKDGVSPDFHGKGKGVGDTDDKLSKGKSLRGSPPQHNPLPPRAGKIGKGKSKSQGKRKVSHGLNPIAYSDHERILIEDPPSPPQSQSQTAKSDVGPALTDTTSPSPMTALTAQSSWFQIIVTMQMEIAALIFQPSPLPSPLSPQTSLCIILYTALVGISGSRACSLYSESSNFAAAFSGFSGCTTEQIVNIGGIADFGEGLATGDPSQGNAPCGATFEGKPLASDADCACCVPDSSTESDDTIVAKMEAVGIFGAKPCSLPYSEFITSDVIGASSTPGELQDLPGLQWEVIFPILVESTGCSAVQVQNAALSSSFAGPCSLNFEPSNLASAFSEFCGCTAEQVVNIGGIASFGEGLATGNPSQGNAPCDATFFGAPLASAADCACCVPDTPAITGADIVTSLEAVGIVGARPCSLVYSEFIASLGDFVVNELSKLPEFPEFPSPQDPKVERIADEKAAERIDSLDFDFVCIGHAPTSFIDVDNSSALTYEIPNRYQLWSNIGVNSCPSSCTGPKECQKLTTVTPFNSSQYFSGEWFVQEAIPFGLLSTEYFYCYKFAYSSLPDPTDFYTFSVANTANNEDRSIFYDSELAPLCGRGEVVPSKAEVGFCESTARTVPYWVVAHDEDEGYALVSGGQPTILTDAAQGLCSTELERFNGVGGLYLLTRERERDEEVVKLLRTMAVDMGIDVQFLEAVDQTNC